MSANSLSILFISLVSLVILPSCGFAPRGSQSAVTTPPLSSAPNKTQYSVTEAEQHSALPAPLTNLYITGDDLYGPFMQTLKKSLIAQGATISESAENNYRLVITEENYSRRTVSFTDDTKAAEYEIRAEVKYSLKNEAGVNIIGPDKIFAEKVYVFNKNQVLGKTQEEETIKKDLQKDLAWRLIQRVRLQLQKLPQKSS